MIRIERLEAIVYRYPLETPVQTSFGLMADRPMVVVRLTNHDGVIGWGEICVLQCRRGTSCQTG